MPQVRKVNSQDTPQTVKTITRTVEQVVPSADAQETSQRPDIGEWWASLTPTERDGYAFYLWRLDPNVVVSDPRVSNPAWRGGKYLVRLAAEDLKELEGQDFMAALNDWTKRKFGGSNYKLLVTNRKTARAEHAKVFAVEGDPVLSERESYRNGIGGAAEGKSGVENIVIAFLKEQLEAAKAKALDPSAAVETAIGMMAKANDRALEIALKQVPPQASAVDQLAGMITAIEKMGLFRRENESEKILRELVAELRTKEEKRSIWDELKSAKEGLAVLGVGRHNGGGSEWVTVVQTIAPTLEKIADRAINAMNARRLVPAMPSHAALPAAAVAPNSGAVPMTVLPPPSVPVHPAPAAAPPPAPAASAPGPLPADQEAFARDVVSNYIFGKIRERFDAGHEGDAVAEWLDDTERTLANQLGYLSAEQLKGLMRQHPIFSPVAEHPRMAQFITDFLAYFQEGEKAEEAKGAA
ncbi:MAG: hypothetical protein ACRD3D_13230 [Terriglobia bacterium]